MSNPQAKEPQSEVEISGRYVVRSQVLGHGAWSVVRPCEPLNGYNPPAAAGDAEEGVAPVARFVAKVIEKAYLRQVTGGADDRARSEIDREVGALRAVPAHPYVVRFIEMLENETHFFIVFEEAPRGDLCELILNAEKGRLPEATAREFAFQIITAVLHCHRFGTAHRDIKPENLLVGLDDTLKLTDFGLAKIDRQKMEDGSPAPNFYGKAPTAALGFANPQRLWDPVASHAAAVALAAAPVEEETDLQHRASNVPPPICQCHEIIGTLRYGAPEMFAAKFSKSTFDAFSADAWSVGVVIYIMLTGTFPFSAGSSANERDTYQVLQEATLHIPSAVPAHAADLLKRLLHKDPTRRMSLWKALDHPWLLPSAKSWRGRMRAAHRLHVNPETAALADSHPTDINGLGRNSVAGAAAGHHTPESLPPGFAALRNAVEKRGDAAMAAAFNSCLTELAAVEDALEATRLRQPAPSSTSTGAVAGGVRRPTSPNRRSIASPARVASPGRVAQPAGRVTPAGRMQSPARITGVSARHSDPSAPASGRTRPGAVAATPPRRAVSPATTPTPRTATPPRGSIRGAAGSSTMRTPPASVSAARQGTPTRPGTSMSSSMRGAPTPLKRQSPVPRRATPLRAVGMSPIPGNGTPTPGRAGPPLPTRTTPARTPLRPGTPVRTLTPGRPGAAGVRAAGSSQTPPASPTPGSAAAAKLAVGAEVTYRGHRAMVRYNGTTGFAAGTWVGLEMLEGNDGIHDGTSRVDGQRYFTCLKDRGVFVRASQIQV